MSFMNIGEGHEVKLPGGGGRPDQVHVFDEHTIMAVDAALAAQRPLLVRGEPGIGKSQLARAVAKQLKRVYVQYVVDARTESRDLLWHYDAVKRLADAQRAGALGMGGGTKTNRRQLDVRNYLRPGPLWWAFDWVDAKRQAQDIGESSPPQDEEAGSGAKSDPANGCVVLIDEVDKAESDVPNGLLEALGAGQFTPIGRKYPIVARGQIPLVIITTNEERALPDAFLRRCLVLHLRLPDDEENLKLFLRNRGRAHFPDSDSVVLCEAAEQLAKDRQQATENRQFPLPGQAEYLDLFRALLTLKPNSPQEQRNLLAKIAMYTFKKHPGAGV